MIYIEQDEINLVRKRIGILGSRLANHLTARLLAPSIRREQHALFWSLLDDERYKALSNALTAITQYDKGRYLNKAISKLSKGEDKLTQFAELAEVVVAGYYFSKYHKDSKAIVWEQPTGANVDITLHVYKSPINIEVTALTEDIKLNTFFDLGDKVKVAIEQKAETFPVQKYFYLFSLAAKENTAKSSVIPAFEEKDIPAFVDFMAKVREKGVGDYTFTKNNNELVKLKIERLNNLSKEHAVRDEIFGGWMHDNKRLCRKIVSKAKKQLPKNEINFIYVANHWMTNDLDFEQAFYGTERLHVDPKAGKVVVVSRAPDGICTIIKQRNLGPIYGLMHSKITRFDKKKLLWNPYIDEDEALIKIIS